MNPLTNPTSAAILTGLVVTLGYASACYALPFKTCKKCTGSGRRRARIGHGWKSCRRCKGHGHRLRTGRRIYNALSHLYREANH